MEYFKATSFIHTTIPAAPTSMILVVGLLVYFTSRKQTHTFKM